MRKAIVRGLAIVMPPLLTLVFFLWFWNIVDSYILQPVEATVRYTIVWTIADIRADQEVFRDYDYKVKSGQANAPSVPFKELDTWSSGGIVLARVNKNWIPQRVFETVAADPGNQPPHSASAYYHRYVQIEHLPRHLVIPAFLSVFILVLYFLGRLFAFGFGRIIWNQIEKLIDRLPIISNVYSSVKQVTDFAFSDNEFQFNRVVAVEYPRRGLWSIGFVTGESMLDIKNAANEPLLSVLMPTSPMPATGFVISVPKSETVDLNITIDQGDPVLRFLRCCGSIPPTKRQAADHNLAFVFGGEGRPRR